MSKYEGLLPIGTPVKLTDGALACLPIPQRWRKRRGYVEATLGPVRSVLWDDERLEPWHCDWLERAEIS